MANMESKQPKFSIIIAARPTEFPGASLKSLTRLDFDPRLLEVIICQGSSPSRQRNEAAKSARGQILYFLDNDSELSRESLTRVVAAFGGQDLGGPAPMRTFSVLPPLICEQVEKVFFSSRRPREKIAVVGGPSIWNRRESFWASIGGIILESFFAYYVMSSRFRPTGRFRFTDERELILCNLAVRRKVFSESGGFREELYPNEENEFLSRLSRKGYGLIYHPGIYVNRPRRESLSTIMEMFFNYGRGRMENLRVTGFRTGKLFLLPLGLLLYFVLLFFYHAALVLMPIFVYFAAAFASAAGFSKRRRKLYLALFLPLLFLVAHLSYALGLVRGTSTSLAKRRSGRLANNIKITLVKGFGENWPMSGFYSQQSNAQKRFAYPGNPQPTIAQ